MSVILNNEDFYKQELANYCAGINFACTQIEALLAKKCTNKELKNFIADLKEDSVKTFNDTQKKPKTSVLK